MEDEKVLKNLGVLNDESQDLLARIRAGCRLELDYWVHKVDPPNLTEAEFKMILANIGEYRHEFQPRKSEAGPHGKTGEKQVFFLHFNLRHGRRVKFYIIKGYFFEEGNLKGVCIQSCRVTSDKPFRSLKIVR